MINILATILRFFGWLLIFWGILSLFLNILLSHSSLLLSVLGSIQQIINGIVSLFLAKGLSYREWWAFYVGFIIFSLNIIREILEIIFVRWSFVLMISIIISFFFIFLLFKGKEQFIQQPKVKISQWFAKPRFLIVAIGTIIVYIISVVVFNLLEGVTIFQVL